MTGINNYTMKDTSNLDYFKFKILLQVKKYFL